MEPKTAEEICSQFGLNNVELEYDEEDYTTLTNYKTFSQHIRPFIIEHNANIAMSRVVQLVGAKWREFQSINPYNKEKTPKKGTYLLHIKLSDRDLIYPLCVF